jgi:preprotein translocase subunit SecB
VTTKPGSLPLSGYSIVSVYLTTAELRPKEPADTNATEPPVTFGWDWRRTTDKSVFEVRLTLALEPVKERPYATAVDAVGRFRQIGDSPSPRVEDFASLQAVAILLPYAREHLTSLTAKTKAGPYYLPSVNVYELMKDFDVAKTSAAAEGLRGAKPTLKAATIKESAHKPRSRKA